MEFGPRTVCWANGHLNPTEFQGTVLQTRHRLQHSETEAQTGGQSPCSFGQGVTKELRVLPHLLHPLPTYLGRQSGSLWLVLGLWH